MSGSVEWVNQAVGHAVGEELTRREAEMVTAKIKSYVGVAWVLLYEAHARKAHKALGYATWADYVAAEFEMSRSRSYQLISQAKIVLEISEAVSTDVDISEAVARDLADHVDEAKAAAVAAADALGAAADAASRAQAAKEAVEQTRFDAVQRARERREREAAEGRNADGEITAPRDEPREDREVSDGEGIPDAEGVGDAVPAPTPSDPDAKNRAVIDAALASLANARRDLDAARVSSAATTEQRVRINAAVDLTRHWCDDIEAALSEKPNLKAV